jgi:hypothetical protein
MELIYQKIAIGQSIKNNREEISQIKMKMRWIFLNEEKKQFEKKQMRANLV